MGQSSGMVVRYQIFRGTLASWNHLFSDAAAFATHVGRENLIGISHSDNGTGVVTVWYWGPPGGE